MPASPAFEAALKKAGKTYEIYIYEGANHAFNNDTNAARYDKEAADLAWRPDRGVPEKAAWLSVPGSRRSGRARRDPPAKCVLRDGASCPPHA